MKQKFRNQDGYILATTLIVLVVMVILSLALIDTSSSESLQSKHYEKQLQAKYLAKSGTEIMADYIINNTDDFEILFLDKAANFPFVKDLNGGSISVDVVKTSDGLEIISEGSFKNSTEETKLLLKNIALGNEPLFYQDLEKVDQDPTKTRYKKGLGEPTISEPTSNGNLNQDKRDYTIDLNVDKKYNNIKIDDGYTLKINTHGQDRILIVDSFKIDGYINLSDDGGRVFLFVKSSATFENSYKDIKNQLIIFAMDGSKVTINPDTDKESYLYIYAPFATLELNSSAKISGSIISASDKSPTVEALDITYRPLNKLITINEYNFFDVQHLYKKDRYDNSSK